MTSENFPPASQAKTKLRHWLIAVSFVIAVFVPAGIVGVYLWGIAQDQYASRVGFTVQREELSSSLDLLGGLTNLSNNSSSDSDILYEFIQTQQMVRRVDATLDLRAIYSRPYAADPVFALSPDSTIEDLQSYWRRMVRISHQPGTGLIEIQALAFAAEDAQAITEEILAASTEMINKLSAVAREDTIRYAREELDLAVEQLTAARQAMTSFRSRTQIVDPAADIQLQMGVLTSLQQRLGEELIALDMLLDSTRSGDPGPSRPRGGPRPSGL
jgi:capsular polysaccharide transport system permease protein